MLTAQGKLFQRVGSLIPHNKETPKCIQTYFYGGDEATKYWMQNMKIKVKYDDTYEKFFKLLLSFSN